MNKGKEKESSYLNKYIGSDSEDDDFNDDAFTFECEGEAMDDEDDELEMEVENKKETKTIKQEFTSTDEIIEDPDLSDSDSDEDVKVKPPEFTKETFLSTIKNKKVRSDMFKKMMAQKKQAKKDLNALKNKEARRKGVTVKKQEPKTIESKREDDITAVVNDDPDLLEEESQDKYSKYYSKSYEPKIGIFASDNYHTKMKKFMIEMSRIFPNAHVMNRKKATVKKAIKHANRAGFTDLIVFNEDQGEPNGMLVIHLPEGPTAYFRMSNLRLTKDIRRHYKNFTDHRPEIILNNFRTRLGRVIARMFGALFHYEPEFVGRRVCTFHNQRDFIFFRHHRYEFKNDQKAALLELGPRFTLKLQWLKDGAFDGDYEWKYNRRQMEKSRCKFHL